MSDKINDLDHNEVLRLLQLADPCATIYCGIVTVDITAVTQVCRALLDGQTPTKETP